MITNQLQNAVITFEYQFELCSVRVIVPTAQVGLLFYKNVMRKKKPVMLCHKKNMQVEIIIKSEITIL